MVKVLLRGALALTAGLAAVSGFAGKSHEEATRKHPRDKTLRVLRTNPRYLTDGSGRAVYLRRVR